MIEIRAMENIIASREKCKSPFSGNSAGVRNIRSCHSPKSEKMEDSGIIEGSRFIVKPDALGFGVCAFIGVILDHAHTYKTVVKEIENIPEVIDGHFITGGFTFLIKLRCNDHQHLMDILINTLQNIPGIAKTETFISLDQLIEKQINLNVDPAPTK